ncbi:glycosyltransferase family 4 protein [Halosimplex aquaticum]|uniref:Glycosyltransferase family 4 protein n=1 Tax=Halosimplex aquaticum TaxID=3026162 RepID=A0ABD5Y3Q8_9EURY|nr:glycosyltransferase family 4 protein [Halosimplex aquaticum]
MRILRVAQNLYPEVPGGGSYHVHAMSRNQAEMGHEVTVLTISNNESLPRRERRSGYTIVRRRPTTEVLGNEISVGAAKVLRRAKGFDAIHAHSHLYFSTNLTAIRRRLGEPPLAITNHGLYSQNAPEWLFNLYLRTAGRWTFNQADVIFCYTDEDRKRVQSLGVDSRIAVVPNGIDTDRFTPNGEGSELIDHEGTVVLFVGRLVDGKRPKDAMKAVSLLPDDLNAKLYIAGDGPLRSELLDDDENVELLGRVSYHEMPAVYRASDVLLLPSRAEGMPRTVLEAMASGLPVVSSDLDHIAPVVRKAGTTVKMGDINGYAEALQKILTSPRKVGQKGRETIIENHTWDETVEETSKVLQQLV